MNRHLDEIGMDRYALGLMAEEEISVFEEHLLICSSCQERLAENDAFVKAMQEASAKYVKERGDPGAGGKRRAAVMVAFSLGLLLSVGTAAWQLAQLTGQAAIVKLERSPGATVGARAPSACKLLLDFDTQGLADLASYDLEIVDHWGIPVTRVNARRGPVEVPALRAGSYFVRLYAGRGELLREYGLEVSDGSR